MLRKKTSMSYWDTFYEQSAAWHDPRLQGPSLFARQVVDWLKTSKLLPAIVLDVGCGTGRDSLFFASQPESLVRQVIGIDRYAEPQLQPRCTFVKADATTWSMAAVDTPVVLYARFFLHTLNSGELNSFLRHWANQLPANTYVFFETRASPGDDVYVLDANKPSVVGQPHDRHLYHVIELIRRCEAVGWTLLFAQQLGNWAPCGDENPVVVRIWAGTPNGKERLRALWHTLNTPRLRECQKRQYVILQRAAALLDTNKLKWHAGFGTMLGAMKWQTFIPWDDDVDICVPLSTLQALANLSDRQGLLVKHHFGENHYRLLDEQGNDIDMFVYGTGSAWEPSAFPTEKEREPLRTAKFGDLTVWIPNNPLPFLQRTYGNLDHLQVSLIWTHSMYVLLFVFVLFMVPGPSGAWTSATSYSIIGSAGLIRWSSQC